MLNLFQANIILSFLLQISVATFHIGRLELSQQSVGRHACIKVQAASLSGEECPAISWEEFQVIFYSVWKNSVRIFDFERKRLHLCLKFRYSQKATKIWKNLPFCFDISTVVWILVRMKSFPRFWRNHP